MAPFRHLPTIGAYLIAALAASSAHAITAKDVMEKMAQEERFGYVTGLIDMLSYQALLAGNQARAKCISDAFYGKKDATMRLLYQSFGQYSDKSPEGIVVVIMNRACGN